MKLQMMELQNGIFAIIFHVVAEVASLRSEPCNFKEH